MKAVMNLAGNLLSSSVNVGLSGATLLHGVGWLVG